MSYCRFSSDDFASDVYCYESVGDFFAIHVAGNRIVPCEPLPEPIPLTQDNIKGWVARRKVVSEILGRSPHVAIGLPHDGETFSEPDAAACADRLVALRALGYVVPQYAIDELRDEAREAEA